MTHTSGSNLLPGITPVKNYKEIAANMLSDLEKLKGKIADDRYTATKDMLEAFRELSSDKESPPVFSYQLKGKNVGLLAMDKPEENKYLKLLAMVALPNTKYVGSTLMQQAMQEAVRIKKKPVIELEAMDEAAAAAYKKMGFEKIFESDSESESEEDMILMRLDARESPMWKKEEQGDWRLKSLSEKQPSFV